MDYNSLDSETFADSGITGSVPVFNPLFGENTATGQEAYEVFNFSGLPIHGQGFLLANSTIGPSRIGFDFDGAGILGSLNFIERLYQEARIGE